MRNRAVVVATMATGLILAAKAGIPAKAASDPDAITTFVAMPFTIGMLARSAGNPYISRAVIWGGYDGTNSYTNGLQRDISTTGNATLIAGMTGSASTIRRAAANDSRSVVGEAGAEYWAQATLGAATSFGNLSNARNSTGHCHNRTRIVYAGGLLNTNNQSTIDYRTIATAGTAVTFGTLASGARRTAAGSITNGTRGVWAGGWTSADSARIDYVTINTTGNSSSFGSLSSAREQPTGGSSTTRGVFGSGTTTTRIDYITIATTGNATTFGTITNSLWRTGVSNGNRILWTPGLNSTTTLQYVTIATTGNATTFGTTPAARTYANPTSGFYGE